MSDTAYTPAQIRAFAWLSADGSWREKPGRLEPAIYSLRSLRTGLVDYMSGTFGPRGGYRIRHRLTPAGIAERARLVAEGKIK